MPLSARAKDFINRGKEVMREPHVDHANIAEAEDDPISRLLTILPRLKKKPIQLQWDIRVFGVDSSDVPLYISLPDALEIVGGNSMLNISIIQLWAIILSGANILSGRSISAKTLHFIYPKVFQDPSPLPEDEIIKIREQWTTFFLQSFGYIKKQPK
uniref:Uncharacterized protein n=1 Tax=Cajanus cajan TaxID=3821 RepID=A0A151R8Z9_CAJCA|nr:hypothetical protein KK1_039603 [Cajanus cajan]